MSLDGGGSLLNGWRPVRRIISGARAIQLSLVFSSSGWMDVTMVIGTGRGTPFPFIVLAWFPFDLLIALSLACIPFAANFAASVPVIVMLFSTTERVQQAVW